MNISPLLAITLDPNEDRSKYLHWFMSEKMDGIRCLYLNDSLFTRNGNIIHAPRWFIDNIKSSIPNSNITILDGELFTKRDDFQHLCSIVKKDVPKDDEWRCIQYYIFDIPSETNIKFIERYEKIKKEILVNDHIKIIEQFQILDIDDIEMFSSSILNKNGEGVMLRDPDSLYEQKRSKSLVKYKKHYDDDAIIVDFELGTGKYKNAIGKFNVHWKNNTEMKFKVGSGMTDDIRFMKNPNTLIGKLIKVKYSSITKSGKPRFPIFLGFRED